MMPESHRGWSAAHVVVGGVEGSMALGWRDDVSVCDSLRVHTHNGHRTITSMRVKAEGQRQFGVRFTTGCDAVTGVGEILRLTG